MSRPLRIEYPGAWHHVMNRGRRSEKIFFDDEDREIFIKTIREAVDLWGLRISAYCLMSNHYHLLVQSPDGNLSRSMRHINGVYTQRFNRRHKKEGQLFRGRYKAVLVDSDNHLLEVLRYIHLNPLRASIIKSLRDYSWSSHQGYLSRAGKWSWLQKEDLLSMLTSVKTKQKSSYTDFVSQGEPEEITAFYSLKNMPSILGSDLFKELIRDRFPDLMNNVEIPEAKAFAPVAEKVIQAVCGFYGLSRSELLLSRRGTVNLPRNVAIYLVRNKCRLTLPKIGREFGISNYSTVSSIIQKVKLRLARDKRLRKETEKIEKKISKGQKTT